MAPSCFIEKKTRIWSVLAGGMRNWQMIRLGRSPFLIVCSGWSYGIKTVSVSSCGLWGMRALMDAISRKPYPGPSPMTHTESPNMKVPDIAIIKKATIMTTWIFTAGCILPWMRSGNILKRMPASPSFWWNIAIVWEMGPGILKTISR